MKEYKEFRIVVFANRSDSNYYFDSLEEALEWRHENPANKAFLLKHIVDGKYDVIVEI